MITVRFFAAAREAAGTDRAQVRADTVSDLQDVLIANCGERMREVLQVSSLLYAGRRLTANDHVPDGAEVDVLPPFAGG